MSYLPLLFLAGALLPLQAGMNAELARHTTPLWSGLLSFFAGAPILLVLMTLAGEWTKTPHFLSVPWWGWLGGCLGALFILSVLISARYVSAAALSAAVIAGQLVAAIALDHFGIAGFERHAVTPIRFVGVVLLFLGSWCVIK